MTILQTVHNGDGLVDALNRLVMNLAEVDVPVIIVIAPLV